jgi:hypothetical protein
MFKQKEEEARYKKEETNLFETLQSVDIRRSYKFLLKVGVAESSVNRSRISCLNITSLFAFLLCSLTSGAFTIDSSTLNEHPIYTVRAKKMPSRIARTQSIMRLCTVSCREKNAIISIIVYLINPFQDSRNAG